MNIPNVLHIQYPVGQGGLHLGIVGNVAYVYDCGGYGQNVDWNSIFSDIVQHLLKHKCHYFHIFISHWHYDHCNKLDDLRKYFNEKRIDYYTYVPPINTPFQKIAYLCEFNGSDEEYNNYYNNIMKVDNKDTIKDIPNFLHMHIKQPKTKTLDRLGFQLSQECNSLFHYGDLNLLLKNMRNLSVQKQVKPRYNIIKHINRYTNHRYMLCLYCYTPLNEKSNWLHTGDATMASKAYRQEMNKHYSSVGLSLKDANIIQIPHHASRYNHDKNFIDIFDSKYIDFLYYTIEGGRVKTPVVTDIISSGISSSRIRQVSASPSTKI